MTDLVVFVRKFLEDPSWIPTIETDMIYSRLHDDHDGTFQGVVRVIFDRMGDAYLSIDAGK